MMHPPNSTDSQPGIRRKLHLIAAVGLIGLVSWVLSCTMLRNATIDDPDSALIFSHPDHAIHVQDCKACHLDP